jgi:peptidoglycan/LPS O-acetylase OafA/YrhL
MFFCVSGMAMAHSVASSPNVLDFYYRRFIRIWPTYALAVGVAVAAAAIMISINPLNSRSVAAAAILDPSKIVRMLLYIEVSTPLTPQFWSLPYEVIFYVLAPMLLLSRRWVLVALAIAAALTVYAAAAVGLQINPASTILENFFLNAMFWFIGGAAAYHFYERIPLLRPTLFWWVAVLLLAFVLAVKTAYSDTSNAVSNASMVILTLLAVRNLPAAIAEFRPTNWGRFSYSIYVYHYAIIVLISFACIELFGIDPKQTRSYVLWMAVVPPVIFACYLLYFVAERPSISYLKRIRRRRPTDKTAA